MQKSELTLQLVYLHKYQNKLQHSYLTCFTWWFRLKIPGTRKCFALIRDDSKYGYDSDGQNFYLKVYHEFQKIVLVSFKDRYKIGLFPKFHRCGSKIVPTTPIWSLNFKRAWQAQLLSHTYETLEKYVSFIYL